MARFRRVVTCLNATGVNLDTGQTVSVACQSFKSR